MTPVQFSGSCHQKRIANKMAGTCRICSPADPLRFKVALKAKMQPANPKHELESKIAIKYVLFILFQPCSVAGSCGNPKNLRHGHDPITAQPSMQIPGFAHSAHLHASHGYLVACEKMRECTREPRKKGQDNMIICELGSAVPAIKCYK